MRRDNRGGEHCAYAGEDGGACALGIFFPRELAARLDQLPNSGWEGVRTAAFYGECEAATQAVAVFDGVAPELVLEVQQVHDSEAIRDAYSRRRMRVRFATMLKEIRALLR
jgi:hypothetical protein